MAEIKAVITVYDLDASIPDDGTKIMVRGRFITGTSNPEFGIKVPIANNWWVAGIFQPNAFLNDVTDAVIVEGLAVHSLSVLANDVLCAAPRMG